MQQPAEWLTYQQVWVDGHGVSGPHKSTHSGDVYRWNDIHESSKDPPENVWQTFLFLR